MLNFTPDFWPVFWIIMGSGAALTVALCLVVAVIHPRRAGQPHQPPVRLHEHRRARTEPPAAGLPRAA